MTTLKDISQSLGTKFVFKKDIKRTLSINMYIRPAYMVFGDPHCGVGTQIVDLENGIVDEFSDADAILNEEILILDVNF